MKVFIGADHDGHEFKSQLAQALQIGGHEVVDVGNSAIDPADDYLTFARDLVTQFQTAGDPAARGILISGDGQGMSIAANRFKGIRAALCWSRYTAESARSQEDCNVLCLSSRYLSLEEAGSVMATFLATPFTGETNASQRLQQFDQLGG